MSLNNIIQGNVYYLHFTLEKIRIVAAFISRNFLRHFLFQRSKTRGTSC